MDCVLIQNGRAHEIWRKTRKADLRDYVTSEILAATVETPEGAVTAGDVWDGTTFAPPPVPPVVTLDAEARAIPRHVRALVLYYLRDKLVRQPTAEERQVAIEALVRAYKDVSP